MENFNSSLYFGSLNYWYDEAIDAISELLDCYPQLTKKIKYISYVLNEGNININNNKYYNFYVLEKLVKNLGIMCDDNYEKLKLNVANIVNRVTSEYSGIIYVFTDGRIEFNERNEFCDNIKQNEDLYEELINYILNDEKFENIDDLIKIEGYNVLDILETTDLNVAECYQYLINLREEKKINLNKLFK